MQDFHEFEISRIETVNFKLHFLKYNEYSPREASISVDFAAVGFIFLNKICLVRYEKFHTILRPPVNFKSNYKYSLLFATGRLVRFFEKCGLGFPPKILTVKKKCNETFESNQFKNNKSKKILKSEIFTTPKFKRMVYLVVKSIISLNIETTRGQILSFYLNCIAFIGYTFFV